MSFWRAFLLILSLATLCARGRPAPQRPETSEALRQEEARGDLLMARKMFLEAVSVYTGVLREKPHDARLLNKIGIAYHQLGDLREAERYYRRAARADKTFASPVNNLGTLEYAKKKYKGAIKYYRRALHLEPNSAVIYSNLGYAYLARKQVREAVLAFQQAVRLDPEVFLRREQAGSIVEQRGGADPATLYFTLAKTFALLGNVEQCAHYLKMARDEGYPRLRDVLKDPAFRSVLKDARIQEVLAPVLNPTPGPSGASLRITKRSLGLTFLGRPHAIRCSAC
jgi:tetratricopeptide (TPR) repeat protein